MKKIIPAVFVFLMGGFFIFSAYTKLEPLEPFKFVLSDYLHIKSWWMVEFLSRAIIGLEFFIGISLITFSFPQFIIKISIAFIIILSGYLIYIWMFYGANEDCGCFGDYMHLNTKESLIKNLLLTGILFFTYKYNSFSLHHKFIKIQLIVFIILSLSFPWIYNAPDKMYENPYLNEKGQMLQVEILSKFNNAYPADSLKSGKKIVCFFSTTCKYCAYASKKITSVQTNYHIQLPVYYIFWGDENTLKIFWEKTKSYRFPYQFAKPDVFFSLSGNQLPAIYFLQDGKIMAKHGYRTLDDKDILDFIGK